MSRESIRTDAASPPAGTYSQAIRAEQLVFLAGQTPREKNTSIQRALIMAERSMRRGFVVPALNRRTLQ